MSFRVEITKWSGLRAISHPSDGRSVTCVLLLNTPVSTTMRQLSTHFLHHTPARSLSSDLGKGTVKCIKRSLQRDSKADVSSARPLSELDGVRRVLGQGRMRRAFHLICGQFNFFAQGLRIL